MDTRTTPLRLALASCHPERLGRASRVACLLGLAAVLATVGAGCGASAPPAAAFSVPAPAVAPALAGASAEELAARVARGDASDEARRALRAHGPRGLDAVLAEYDAARARGAEPAVLERLSAAADTAAQQRDAVVSRLYWYTDLEAAERAAKAEHKPILSLRMLGHLDDELSCANSRFFRTTLYPDGTVNPILRDRFVLHWSSERPVPVVTIDYGDGRIVRRTITGNSIHYVLDQDGRVVDGIPGLYAPREFAAALTEGERAAELSHDTGDEGRSGAMRSFHEGVLSRVRASWNDQANAVGFAGSPMQMQAAPPVPGVPPPALVAIPAAASKMAVEMPIARAIAFELPDQSQLDTLPWNKIGERLRPAVHLDDASRALMRSKAPLDWSSGKPKPLDDPGFAALVDKFEAHVAADMAKNEYYFHARIRRMLADDPTMSLETLNRRVYSELFLTPANDPWLGLVPPVVYSGIQGDGLVGGH
jgi:hypothetical protein